MPLCYCCLQLKCYFLNPSHNKCTILLMSLARSKDFMNAACDNYAILLILFSMPARYERGVSLLLCTISMCLHYCYLWWACHFISFVCEGHVTKSSFSISILLMLLAMSYYFMNVACDDYAVLLILLTKSPLIAMVWH